ncbi:hypothetical protein HDK77DRAFT_267967 [Phyllosticta capitalensis]
MAVLEKAKRNKLDEPITSHAVSCLYCQASHSSRHNLTSSSLASEHLCLRVTTAPRNQCNNLSINRSARPLVNQSSVNRPDSGLPRIASRPIRFLNTRIASICSSFLARNQRRNRSRFRLLRQRRPTRAIPGLPWLAEKPCPALFCPASASCHLRAVWSLTATTAADQRIAPHRCTDDSSLPDVSALPALLSMSDQRGRAAPAYQGSFKLTPPSMSTAAPCPTWLSGPTSGHHASKLSLLLLRLLRLRSTMPLVFFAGRPVRRLPYPPTPLARPRRACRRPSRLAPHHQPHL